MKLGFGGGMKIPPLRVSGLGFTDLKPDSNDKREEEKNEQPPMQ